MAAFCDAAVAAVAAAESEDPEVMMPAFEALVAASPEDILPAVEAVIATDAEPGDPEFDEPWTAMIDYVRANCGFAEINVALSEYAFGGIPEEVPAGPTILTAEAIGEEVHEMIIVRINDDVTLDAGGDPRPPGGGAGHDGDVRRWRLRGLPRDQSIHALRSHARSLRGHLLLPRRAPPLRCSSR